MEEYNLPFIISTIQNLAIRRLWIMPSDLIEAIGELDAAGIEGMDALTSLRVFLERQAPKPNEEARIFPGWKAMADAVPNDGAEAIAAYGADAVRVALVMKKRYETALSV